MISQRRRTRSQQVNEHRILRNQTRHSLPNFTYELRNNDSEGDDDELEVIDELVSLIDPISKHRIQIPMKSKHCRHPQCFDLSSFLDLYRLTDELFYLPDFNKLNRFTHRKKDLTTMELQNKEMTELFEIKPINKQQSNTHAQACIRRSSISPNSRDTMIPCPICRIKIHLTELHYDDFTKAILSIDSSIEKYLKLTDNEVKVIHERKESVGHMKRSKSEEESVIKIIELDDDDSDVELIELENQEDNDPQSEDDDDDEVLEADDESSISDGSPITSNNSKTCISLPTPSVTPIKSNETLVSEQIKAKRRKEKPNSNTTRRFRNRERESPPFINKHEQSMGAGLKEGQYIKRRKESDDISNEAMRSFLALSSEDDNDVQTHEFEDTSQSLSSSGDDFHIQRYTKRVRKKRSSKNDNHKNENTSQAIDIVELSSDSESNSPVSDSISTQESIQLQRHSRLCRLRGADQTYNINQMSRDSQIKRNRSRKRQRPSSDGSTSRSRSNSDSSISSDTIRNLPTVANDPSKPFVISEEDEEYFS